MTVRRRLPTRLWRVKLVAGPALSLALLLRVGVCLAADATGHSAVANEAVRNGPQGRRAVELPPGFNVARLPAQPAPGHGGTVYTIETDVGLAECTHRWYRIDECRPPSFGRLQLMRAWIVKRKGAWWQCSLPSKDAKCVRYGELVLSHTLM